MAKKYLTQAELQAMERKRQEQEQEWHNKIVKLHQQRIAEQNASYKRNPAIKGLNDGNASRIVSTMQTYAYKLTPITQALTALFGRSITVNDIQWYTMDSKRLRADLIQHYKDTLYKNQPQADKLAEKFVQGVFDAYRFNPADILIPRFHSQSFINCISIDADGFITVNENLVTDNAPQQTAIQGLPEDMPQVTTPYLPNT